MEKQRKHGFASMDSEKQKAIARQGGLAVSMNRAHMQTIGQKGGQKSAEKRRKHQRDEEME